MNAFNGDKAHFDQFGQGSPIGLVAVAAHSIAKIARRGRYRAVVLPLEAERQCHEQTPRAHREAMPCGAVHDGARQLDEAAAMVDPLRLFVTALGQRPCPSA